MNKLVIALAGIFFLISCRNDKKAEDKPVEETLTSGSIVLLTDNTLQPIVDDVLTIFHSVYDRANIKQVNKDEAEIINLLLKDSAAVAVLPRKLTAEEENHFLKRKITPRISQFGFDAVALITNKQSTDTIINLEDIYNILRGNESSLKSKLVFDNPSSSTVQYLLAKAGVTKVPERNIYSLQSTGEVVKYVHDNKDVVGIIGLNWLLQPPASLSGYVENIKVMGVKNVKAEGNSDKYYKPSQRNLGLGLYPLTRSLYVLNYQGKNGLGMGFATYIRGTEGQRIILKSGLLPVMIPTREIAVRKELETTE